MAKQLQSARVLEWEEVPRQYLPRVRAVPQPTNSGLALAAFFTAAAAWLVIPAVGAVAAIVLGILAHRQIRHANGRLKGSDLATAAIVTSGVQIGFIIFAVVGVLLAVPAG